MRWSGLSGAPLLYCLDLPLPGAALHLKQYFAVSSSRGLTMRILLVILVVLCAALATMTLVLFERHQDQTEQIALLNAQRAAPRASIEDQGKCAAHAAKLFNELGYNENVPAPGFQRYASHYNITRGKCFVLIEHSAFPSSGGGVQNTRTINLYDAVERRSYGDFLWISSGTKKYWEVKPMMCRTNPSVATEELCDSEEQFKEFVAKYME
jgi:hypothetical protein